MRYDKLNYPFCTGLAEGIRIYVGGVTGLDQSRSFLDDLNAEILDVFREIGNIGSGNAVTALASLLDKEIDMSVPSARIVSFNEIVNILHGPEALVTGVLVGMEGDMNGNIMLLMTPEEAYEICSLALGETRQPPPVLTTDTLDPMDQSVLMEVGNILVGAYLMALCELTGLNLQATVPALAVDMAGAIVSVVAIEFSQVGDQVLFLETQFSSADRKIGGDFFLVPDDASFKVLLNALGLGT
jgi:chemotaxis protein CheC